MIRRTLSALLLTGAICASAACSGDATGPEAPSLSGRWTFNASNMSGSGMSCNLSAVALNISQQGNTFTGTYSGGRLTCTAGGQVLTQDWGSGTVVNGSVNGNSIAFDFDTSDYRQTGTLSGNSISGNGVWREDLGAPYGVVTLNGSFSAAR